MEHPYLQADKPAPPVASQKNVSNDKCKVLIDFTIFSILEISEVDSYMELAFDLGMTWQDPRLIFYNLKDQIELNVLTKDEQVRV